VREEAEAMGRGLGERLHAAVTAAGER
jgi:hypothetical protein